MCYIKYIDTYRLLKMSIPTVSEYIIQRLSALGIDKAFGVPGDFSFPIDDAIEKNKQMDWVLCTNELNAAYAADGYARQRGGSLLTVTYGVGCLSAINGLMGSFAHRVPVFLVAGAPSDRLVAQGLITHHTLGDGVYHNFDDIIAKACCATATLRPDNVVQELERVIYTAFHESRPVYLSVPSDGGLMPIIGEKPVRFIQPTFSSVKQELTHAIAAIEELWRVAKRPIALLSTCILRFNQQASVLKLIKELKLPYAIMPNDKGTLDEQSSEFIGIYAGDFSSPLSIKEYVEHSDFILDIGGVVFEQFSTGFFSSILPVEHHVIVRPHQTKINAKVFTNVFLGDVVASLIKKLKPIHNSEQHPPYQSTLSHQSSDVLCLSSILGRLQSFLKENDIFVAESGSCAGPAASIHLPKGARFEAQFLWGSIGWATPATLGISLAEPKKRVVLLTGDGAHQMTLLELINMGRYKVKPIIFVIDNQAYGAEYEVHLKRMHYNELVGIDYADLPGVFKCDAWFCKKVYTLNELDDVLRTLEQYQGAAYIQLCVSSQENKSLPPALIDRAYQLKAP